MPAILRAVVLSALAVGAVACSTPDPRTPEERAADQAIASEVKSTLRADADLYAPHIDVNTRRGVVWLTGWVGTAGQAQAAVRDTQAVPGVKKVVNQIDVMDWTNNYD
jgi:osmotically-inducible protein OsmY